MKKMVRGYLFLVIFLLVKINVYGTDSLKVFVCGYFFKNETFKIYYIDKIYIKKVKKGMRAFSFFIPFDTAINKNYSIINLRVFRKGKWGLKYRDTKLVCRFEEGKKYFVLRRDFRLKDRYALDCFWTNDPFYYIGGRYFWNSGEIPKIFQCDTIIKNKRVPLASPTVKN